MAHGHVHEDPSSGELRSHFVKAALFHSQTSNWPFMLKRSFGNWENQIVETNSEGVANYPEPELAISPNHRKVEKSQAVRPSPPSASENASLPQLLYSHGFQYKLQLRLAQGVTFSPARSTAAALKKCLPDSALVFVFALTVWFLS